MIEAFRQGLVEKLTGLTRRQLRRLERLGVVMPSVAAREEGWPPLYSFEDLVKLKVVAELLSRDFNTADIKRLIVDLEQRGILNPLTVVRIVLDEPTEEEQRHHPSKGRAFVILPGEDAPTSGKHPDQLVKTFDLKLREVRSDLVGTIEQLTTRPTGKVEQVRGVKSHAWVVAGTRVPTALIAKLTRAGWSRDRIRESYPHLTPEDIAAALRHEKVRSAA